MSNRIKRRRASDVLGCINEINRLDACVARLDRELADARECLLEMRDILARMNFGDSFPAITRAIENANRNLEETK